MTGKPKPLERLLGEQADASDPKKLVWLSASAGTGKTHVLTARVLRLLLSGAAPGSILCLTFTKAGAAEMADRIQARLASWVRMSEPKLKKELFALGEANDDRALRKARRLFAGVLDAPGGGLRIQTIHAFAQTLLAAFPAEAGLVPGFKPLEGRAEAALARETLGRLLADAEAQGDLGLIADAQALSRRLGEEAAERYLRLCARAPQAMVALGMRQGIEARVRSALDVWLGDVEARIIEECRDFDCAGLRAIRAANLAWGTKTGLDHADRIDRFLNADAVGRAALLPEMIAMVRTKDGTPRAISTKLLGCDAAHGDNCEALGEAIGALVGQRTRAATAVLIAAGLRAGQAYALAYAEAKRAAGVVDFDDLIRLTVDLLEQEGIGQWIRFKLDSRIDHVLIDEGQDTNQRQWAIVKALADEYFVEEAGEETRAARTIFSVGDFKQAIFGFQGTDPANFAEARSYFSGRAADSGRTVEHLSIDRSFRSTPPILTVIDRLTETIGREAMGLEDDLKSHISAQADGPGTVTVWQTVTVDMGEDAEDPEEGWIDDAARLFASKLAEQVRQWIAAPLWLPAKKRPLRPEDVLILVRKRGDLASLIVARLHAAGVPVAGVDRLRLDAPLAVKDLMAAVRFVLQPEDDLTLASLLVSPLFGLSQGALYELAFGRSGTLWSALLASEQESVVRDLKGLLNAADFTTPYQFLEAILSGPLDGRRRLLARLGDEARDPIEELLNAALAFEREATPTLQRFLDWFDRGEVEVTRDPSAPLDAVRVMTVHGAKGLQAPLVILADATGDPTRAPKRGLEWLVDAEGEAVPVIRPRKGEVAGSLAEAAEALEKRELQEHWRLLYVAATRAEERLVIAGSLGPQAKGIAPEKSWWATFATVMDGMGIDPVEDPLWVGARHYRGDRPQLAEVRAPRAADRTIVEAPLPEWLRRSAPQESRPPRPLAPSAPGEDDSAQPPPSPAMRAAARRGRLLHSLFERLPAITPDERHTAAIRWLTESAGVEDVAEAEAIARDACTIIATPDLRAIFSDRALAEAPIAAVLGDGIVVAGTVDRLLIEADRVQVIDYKTSRAVPASVDDVPTGHLRQMAAYVAALRVIFPDRQVEAALLYTAAPVLLPLPDALLDRHKPSLQPMQQKLALGG
ncbi:ATP-dependent helicase/nuclease subunit A [Sphingomonas vulcanisoli]|uniref:DNA 3'-5' helicase n=1 Tax=Sphingomonas vulcanisoli TaxID=1658060 RepID=A0ABX0TWB4_9SPHN|nr:double-strand break repair helicase AddA [Sphingomonas vulcanisoli]NIJ08080.1 ATP-dependent helicase/nuclease subunit A [Sphingomonas vulcanisoli]